MGKKLSPRCREILIKKYIGKELYYSVHPETRYILMKEAMQTFNREMVTIFGSLYEYKKDWCRRNGFETYHEYQRYLCDRNGFESFYEYQKDWCRKKGFKNKYEYNLWWIINNTLFNTENEYREDKANKRGFKTRGEYFNYLAKKKGFNNFYEEDVSRIKKRGFKDRKEYRKFLCEKWGVENTRKLTELKKQVKKDIMDGIFKNEEEARQYYLNMSPLKSSGKSL